jgi:hypothetical protein
MAMLFFPSIAQVVQRVMAWQRTEAAAAWEYPVRQVAGRMKTRLAPKSRLSERKSSRRNATSDPAQVEGE